MGEEFVSTSTFSSISPNENQILSSSFGVIRVWCGRLDFWQAFILFISVRRYMPRRPPLEGTHCRCKNVITGQKIIRSQANVTWHCWGPPCRVGDAVFGLCFFIGVDKTAAGKLEFDDGVTVVARVVMVRGCWVVTTIEADDDAFDEICEALDDDATVSITLATENINWVVYNAWDSFLFFDPKRDQAPVFNFHYFQPSIYLCLYK